MSPPLARLWAPLLGVALAFTVVATPATGAGSDAASVLQGDSCDHPAPTPTEPLAKPLRVGTFNIRANRSTADFAAALNAFLPYVDLAGLQEINSKDKAQVLANLADNGWSFWRQYRTNIPSHPHQGGTEQQPVLWRSDRFVCTYAGPVLMAGVFRLGGETQPAWDTTRPHFFTLVQLVDRVTGQKLSILNAHLPPGVIAGGRPVPGIPRHVRCYRETLASLVAKANSQVDYGQVFAMGDYNVGYLQDLAHRVKGLPYRKFHRIGFKSMWATQTPANGMGTHNNALIDQVWSRKKATRAKVLFKLKGYSDHLPAVATYAQAAVSPPAG